MLLTMAYLNRDSKLYCSNRSLLSADGPTRNVGFIMLASDHFIHVGILQ